MFFGTKLELIKYLERYDDDTVMVAPLWLVEDVQQQAPLNHQQSVEVLKVVAHNHDANIGINWDVLDSTIEDLFDRD